jgi:hypothetical protein
VQNRNVTYFLWNNTKNKKLKQQRGIGFEDIVYYIQAGELLDEVEHPNQEKYPGQRILYVNVSGYVHLIPYVDSEDGYFLKTIIPSRKATKQFLGEQNE